MPPEALEKTDRTIVTTVPTTEQQKIEIDKHNAQNGTTLNDQYQVQVYKNNNYRNWEWSAGYDQHGGDRYVPVEAQEILDFAPLVKKYTWNKSDDEKAEAFPIRFIPLGDFFYL